MTSIDRPTLLRPPEPDKNKAPIENVLEVTELKALGPVSATVTGQGHIGVISDQVAEMLTLVVPIARHCSISAVTPKLH